MNKILTALVAVSLLFTFCACGKSGVDSTVTKNEEQQQSQGIAWSIEGDTLVLTGSTRMFDYNTYEVENESIPWFFEKNNFSTVKVDEGVTYIGTFSFFRFDNIKAAEIAGTVDSIGSSAFAFCENLKKVTLGEGVREIGMGAFGSCKSLEEINIPSTVTKIDKGAFYGCSSLEKLEIPSTVTVFGDDLFTDCSSLTVYCEEGSAAQAQAEKYGVNCEIVK